MKINITERKRLKHFLARKLNGTLHYWTREANGDEGKSYVYGVSHSFIALVSCTFPHLPKYTGAHGLVLYDILVCRFQHAHTHTHTLTLTNHEIERNIHNKNKNYYLKTERQRD